MNSLKLRCILIASLTSFSVVFAQSDARSPYISKEYAFPWTGSGKKVFKVGVSFDYEKRNVGEWVYAV